jgi:SAM-dependent methyltransferase
MKDTAFYNNEASIYSAKRYPQKPVTFTQFFFKERLQKALGLVGAFLHAKQSATLLEIGCADGVVARALWERFPAALARIDAVDISPGMIEAAAQKNADTPIRFSVRDTAPLLDKYDLIIETGVLNYTDTATDFAEAAQRLTPDGEYICSIAGSSSAQQGLKGDSQYLHLYSYKIYEAELQKYFTIACTVPVGLFVPLLWKLPALARILQPVAELVLKIAPNLALEKIYVLTGKK